MSSEIEWKASPGSPFISRVVEANCLTPLCMSVSASMKEQRSLCPCIGLSWGLNEITGKQVFIHCKAMRKPWVLICRG